MNIKGKVKQYKFKKRIKKCKKYSLQLKDTNFCLLSSMCIGGIIYHDLGLQFNTPTINLRFRDYDFYYFCIYLNKYLEADLEFYPPTNFVKYLAGVLHVKDMPDVVMYFPHDNDFAIVKENWERRKKRMNFNNIRIIAVQNIADQKSIDLFTSIPFKNKIMLYGTCLGNKTNEMFYNSFLEREKPNTSRSIAGFKNLFSSKRNFDSFDWYNFLKK